jgi:hypothetical protein
MEQIVEGCQAICTGFSTVWESVCGPMCETLLSLCGPLCEGLCNACIASTGVCV